MKCFIICLLILLSWLPAWSQRSAYDPAAKQPAKQGDGFVDFALKQVNPQNKDYGCQIDDARKLMVDETIKSVDFLGGVSCALVSHPVFLLAASPAQGAEPSRDHSRGPFGPVSQRLGRRP